MMGVVARLGKADGPRAYAQPQGWYRYPRCCPRFTEAKAGKIEYRLDKTNIIHCPIGKASFGG